MTKKEKAAFVANTLNKLYPRPAIPLDHVDPYTLLVAVVLSAQCTDKKVNEVTPVLFAKAHTPKQMAALEVEEIREIIKPCGLSPAKSKGIHGLSEIILEKHGGQVPNTFEELEALPSVGHKTASVVMSQAFGVPAFPVDTHIHRLAWRWGLSTGKNVERTEADFGVPAFPVDTHIHRLAWRWGLSTGKNVERTEADLKRLFPKDTWNVLHLQIIYFGRAYCPARGHDPLKCPICKEIGRKTLFN